MEAELMPLYGNQKKFGELRMMSLIKNMKYTEDIIKHTESANSREEKVLFSTWLLALYL
jgi:hypothetical protein